MLSSVNTPEMPRTAAARVFDLPELLEKILLQLPFVEDNQDVRKRLIEDEQESNSFIFTPLLARNQDATTPGRFPDPVKDLFIIQRVNSTFRDLIAGSRVLQRRMLLAAHTDSSDVNPHNSIRWLLETIGVDAMQDRWSLMMWTTKQRVDIRVRMMREHRKKTSGQSWRKMKVRCTEHMVAIPLMYASWELEDVQLAEFKHGDATTLGQLSDGLTRLVPLIARYEYEYAKDDEDETLCTEALQRLKAECARDDLWL